MYHLDSSWKIIKEDFKIVEKIGCGVSGDVVKAIHREAKVKVAIKKIKCSIKDLFHLKFVLREISILRQLT